jgi:hypothetical protein
MGKLPKRPIIVVEVGPKSVKKKEMIRISARLFDKKTLALMEVSRIYMTINSLKDGHTVWPLEVIRKNASGFDIEIGTHEMKEGHDYLIRVSNNWNLSPSAATSFKVEEGAPVGLVIIPIMFAPTFIKKYQDKGITDVPGLVNYLRSQGMSDEAIQQEVKRILKEVQMEEQVKIPIDLERRVVTKRWVAQMDHRVCTKCLDNSTSGENFDGVWPWDDPNAPEWPAHPNCRCTYDLEYAEDRTDDFRAAAIMSRFTDLELPLNALKVINQLPT